MATVEGDYYEILGVSRHANTAEIKRAFRQLARVFHPDVTTASDGEQRFREIVAAYDVLSDPKARAHYDKVGLGRRWARRRAASPPAPPLDLELEWYEGQRGASKLVWYEERIACASCAGRGVEGGVAPATCAHCRGEGLIKKASYDASWARLIQFERCAACDGRGHDLPHLCATCDGSGRQTVARSVRVRVPAGVRDGDVLQVDGVSERFRIRIKARPRDSRLVLVIAAVGLACALALLFFELTR